MTARRPLAALAAAALAGCVAGPAPGPLGGTWGGRGVALALDPAGGRLEYDCAAGTIDGPLALDAAGRFAASGTHTPGLGGPVHVDQRPAAYPARYAGTVRGDAMRLTVEVPARGLSLGPFALRRGAPAELLRCL